MYLYGASVQGIQGFIFETNKLKEIVGASDLIEQFCSLGFLGRFSKEFRLEIKEVDVLRNAGGNIRIAFTNKEDLEKMVKSFPQYVMSKAYGITLSQALVEFGEHDYLKKKDELEYKLTKVRNQASIPLDGRFSLMKQTPRTGKPSFEKKVYKEKGKDDKVEFFDKGNWQKDYNTEEGRVSILLEKLKLADIYKKFPLEMNDIAKDNANNKIAIIHADGNRMGLMLQEMNRALKDASTEKIQKVFKDFSSQITKSTNDAVKEAFEKNFRKYDKENKFIPFRPIVIGGDDVTVICRADDALGFTQDYLEAFENNTKKNFKEHGLSGYAEKLTACAGIAFCNKKFPFHYAVDLAEALCSFAKETSKREASCLVFHNIQSSYFTDYKSYVKNELITREGISLQFAPYFTEGNRKPTVKSLIEAHKNFSDPDVPLGKYREWLFELNKSHEYGELFLERVDALMRSKLSKTKYKDLNKGLYEMDEGLRLNSLIANNKTPMADILQLKSVLGGKK
ncbi:MAG: FIG00471280: hypothetical protein [uncultured Sulfurovum sp.]|uniref:Cas10/Cmr2 second palm domain-containing protein n=1 Tax=uncultured Sulfurovum sp. TaxID=269237 RepID=A0A6S6TFX7_9BACT|nr:MAG: FIG00471280: hypothetical protein [uncultured Sulfurovum sp.]